MQASTLPSLWKAAVSTTGHYLIGFTIKPAGWRYNAKKMFEEGTGALKALAPYVSSFEEISLTFDLIGDAGEAERLHEERLTQVGSDPLCLNSRPPEKLTKFRLGLAAMADLLKPWRRKNAAYKMTNVETGHFYVGSTNDVNLRFRGHSLTLRSGTHASQKFQSSFETMSAVEFEIFEVPDRDAAYELEQNLIDKYINDPLFCNTHSSSTGWGVLPEEQKRKMTEGRLNSPKWREFVRTTLPKVRGMDGKQHSAETKKKMSIAAKNRTTR